MFWRKQNIQILLKVIEEDESRTPEEVLKLDMNMETKVSV
jgi:hypothetical protein